MTAIVNGHGKWPFLRPKNHGKIAQVSFDAISNTGQAGLDQTSTRFTWSNQMHQPAVSTSCADPDTFADLCKPDAAITTVAPVTASWSTTSFFDD